VKLITILGCTATGKTALAARLAYEIGGEVISADSRQVYRGMDLGTGKDLSEFHFGNQRIPCHLIDLADPGTEYNLFMYQQDFSRIFPGIVARGKQPVLCGGSGMYLEAVLKGYKLPVIRDGEGFLAEMELMSDEELVEMLKVMKPLHNKTDIEDRERTVKALMIARKTTVHNYETIENQLNSIESTIFGIVFPREQIMSRIRERLDQRLGMGMITEVETLLNKGIPAERLIRYGLEYRFITRHIIGELTYYEMVEALNIAIRQFAKRQMTWFRRMERQGFTIHWIDGQWPMQEKLKFIHDRAGL
jgi:tRNA dimethylallyltransferase